MIDCMNDEQDSSEDEKNLPFWDFCFHHLAATASATAGFDLSLNSLGVWEFGSFERIQGRRRRAAGIE